jgi:hypothetical protein
MLIRRFTSSSREAASEASKAREIGEGRELSELIEGMQGRDEDKMGGVASLGKKKGGYEHYFKNYIMFGRINEILMNEVECINYFEDRFNKLILERLEERSHKFKKCVGCK